MMFLGRRFCLGTVGLEFRRLIFTVFVAQLIGSGGEGEEVIRTGVMCAVCGYFEKRPLNDISFHLSSLQ